MSTTNTLRRSRPRNPGKLAIAAAMALIVPLLASCSGESAAEPADRKIGTTIEELTELAQEEGKVHLIAYPDDWANYAASFAAFEEKFGVEVEVSSPDASSAEELQAVETLKGQSTQPDVLDIGYSFVDPAKERGLVDHYVPTVAGEIPENLKDPDGYWTGAYYGVLSIGVDANVVDVPETWADLKDPQYKGKIAIGDPRAGASQLAAVLAAAIANGGSVEDIQPGIDFFTELADEGYLVAASDGALQTGEAAVTFDWNYNYSGVKEQMQRSGIDLQDVVPGDGVFGNFYAQPVTIDSPQPNAGRLWIEWLLSDEGAEIYAGSGAVPARFDVLAERGALSQEALDSLPSPEVLEDLHFPTATSAEIVTAAIVEQWGSAVGNKIGQ